MLCPRMEAAYGYHRRILRIDLTADQSLQRTDNPRRQHDRVFCGVRIGSVATNAAHLNVDAINVGECKAR
jgi:hypothetical protein